MGSEMCIRDRLMQMMKENPRVFIVDIGGSYKKICDNFEGQFIPCLLYTSDAADERSSVDLGGSRIIKKKTSNILVSEATIITSSQEK